MKAVIVEIKDEFASVLSDDGCVLKIKNNGYEIGQVIQMKSPKVNMTKKIMAFTASAAAVLLLSVGSWAYASPYSYVSLDVNPSIEYIANRFDRVLRVKSVNDDGEEILKEIKLDNLKHHSIQNALAATVEQISEAGYFSQTDEGGIVIATSAKDQGKAEELAQSLQLTVQGEIDQNGDNVQLEVISVIPDRVKEAQELGVTPGKLNLVEKLQQNAVDPDSIILEEWLNKPVKEIMKATKDYRKASDTAEPEADTDANASDAENTDAQTDEASDKAAKEQEKAEEKAEKEQKKAEDKADKAQDKSDKAQDKSSDKSEKEQSKADKASDKSSVKASKEQAKNNADDKAQKQSNVAEDNSGKNNSSSDDRYADQENKKKNQDNSPDNTPKENGNKDNPGKSDGNGNSAKQADDNNNKAADKATDEIANKAADSAAYVAVVGNNNIDSSSEEQQSSTIKEAKDMAEKESTEKAAEKANQKENASSAKPDNDPAQNGKKPDKADS